MEGGEVNEAGSDAASRDKDRQCEENDKVDYTLPHAFHPNLLTYR